MNNEKLRADIKSALNGMPLAAMGTYAELLNRAYAALGEIDRLRSELGKANSQTAHFEREWYLRGDEIEALTAKLGEQASAPAGYVMVPVEPTHEMLEALWGRSFDQFDEGGAKKIARIKYQGLLAAAPKAEPVQEPLDQYDAGLLNDFGGGNVEWWQDYIRAELGRAHDFYQSQVAGETP